MPAKKTSSKITHESTDDLKKRAVRISNAIRKAYPDPETALEFTDAFQLLIATILSAQTTDEQVNKATPALFKAFPTAPKLAAAELEEIEPLIRTTGFYRNKAKSIRNCAIALVEQHGGKVPEAMDDLVKLPGVGRKTAHCVRAGAMGKPGIIVDTHFKRLANRLGLTTQSDPVKIEYAIADLLPESHWSNFSNAIIWHGRRVCNARKPNCAECVLLKDCPTGQDLTAEG